MKKELMLFLGSIFGSLFFAICSISCCLAPLIFILFGVSISFADTLPSLAPLRFFFVAMAVSGMGYGFWRLFISKKPLCSSFITPKYQKIMFVFFTVITIFIIVYPYIDGLFWSAD